MLPEFGPGVAEQGSFRHYCSSLQLGPVAGRALSDIIARVPSVSVSLCEREREGGGGGGHDPDIQEVSSSSKFREAMEHQWMACKTVKPSGHRFKRSPAFSDRFFMHRESAFQNALCQATTCERDQQPAFFAATSGFSLSFATKSKKKSFL